MDFKSEHVISYETFLPAYKTLPYGAARQPRPVIRAVVEAATKPHAINNLNVPVEHFCLSEALYVWPIRG